MKVDPVLPKDLGVDELRTWESWQRADPRLDNPFLSANFAQLAGRVRADARVAVITDNDHQVGFWPLSLKRSGVAGPIVPNYTGLQGIVHAPGWSWDWREVVEAGQLAGWEFDHLVAHQACGLPGRVRPGSSAVMDLSGGWDCYEQWLQSHHKSVLQKAKRMLRRAQASHDVSFVADDRDPGILAELIRQKSAQCRRRGWVDVFAPTWARELAERAAGVAEAAMSGTVSSLRFDGQPVAMALFLDSYCTRALWFSVFDPDFASYWPGMLLILKSAEAAASKGLTTLSLGKGDEPFKKRLAQREDPLASGALFANGLRGGLLRVSRVPVRAAEALMANSPRIEASARGGVRRLRQTGYRLKP